MSEPHNRIRSFVAQLDRSHRVAAVVSLAVAHALVLFTLFWVVEIVVPRFATAAGVALALIWVLGVVATLRSMAAFTAARMDRAYGLGDRLVTWTGGGVRGPMAAWLERMLVEDLAALPRWYSRRDIRRRLRPLRVLVPLLVAVLILRALAPKDRPHEHGLPLAGVTLPDPRSGSGAGEDTGGAGESAPSGGAADQGGSQPPPPEPESPEEQAPDPQTPDPIPPPETPDPQPTPPEPDDPQPDEPETAAPPPSTGLPPPSMTDVEREDVFVIPSFIGEGPSETGEAHVARAGDGSQDGTPAQSAPGTPQPRGAASPDDVPEDVFERAVETALQSRHVRPDERAMVRRWFEQLRGRRR